MWTRGDTRRMFHEKGRNPQDKCADTRESSDEIRKKKKPLLLYAKYFDKIFILTQK